MARKRDVVVAVVIISGFLIAFGLFSLMFIGVLTGDSDYNIAGFGSGIGIIELTGVIDESSGRPVIKQIEDWIDNNSISAIVIHLNTPGGGVAISQEIYDAILRARETKPVIAAMGSVAASGGFYVACATDRIVANPGSLTGSIGVIMQFHTYADLMDKIGIETETIKSGELKDVGNYSRSMTKKEELMLRSVVMDSYEQFVSAISEGRGLETDQIYPLADGSIYTGLQAYNLGLVDTLGGLDVAVKIGAELSGLTGKPNKIRPYKKKNIGIFDLMKGILRKVDNRLNQGFIGPKLMYLYE